MERMIIGCLLIVGIVTVGCATTNSTKDLNRLSKKEVAAYNANPENTDKIVCTKEKPIGSKIPKRVCHMESKIKDRQFRDQQVMQEIQRNTPPLPSNH